MTVLTEDLTACATGAYVTANKALAWGSATLHDQDAVGKFFSIVDDVAGRYNRLWYPANAVGTTNPAPLGTQEYQIALGKPGVAVTIECDLLFETGFDMSHGPGKCVPAIQWGSVNSGPSGGTRAFVIWGSAITQNPKPFNAILQDQRNGGQFVQPPVTSGNIAMNHWYHWKVQMLGGSGGFAKYWLDDHLLTTCTNMGNTAVDDTVYVDVVHFAGGGPGSGPHSDSYARRKNLTITIADDVVIPPIEESIRSARVLLA